MYSPPNGFSLPGTLDYSQSFSNGLSNRLAGFGYRAQSFGNCDPQASLFDRPDRLAGGNTTKVGAGNGFGTEMVTPWPASGFTSRSMWPTQRFSDSGYSQMYGEELGAASGHRTVVDDVRAHPYHRLNKLTAWHELNQAAACGCESYQHPTPQIKVERPTVKEEATERQVAGDSGGTNSTTIPAQLSLSMAEQFLVLELRLCDALRQLHFESPVTHIYNPLEYAMVPHRQFVSSYCTTTKDVLYIGINPGPYGMAQTGVPFGEVTIVKDWLRICGPVYKPNPEHPKRPIWGYDCTRSEVSGARFWKLFQQVCGTPDKFFRRCYVHNMCPLLFMTLNGKNLTPPDLPAETRRQLNAACDRSLADVVRLLRVRTVVAVGKYTQSRARTALRESGVTDVDVTVIMHPSPASPAANKAWNEIALSQITQAGLLEYFK